MVGKTVSVHRSADLSVDVTALIRLKELVHDLNNSKHLLIDYARYYVIGINYGAVEINFFVLSLVEERFML